LACLGSKVNGSSKILTQDRFQRSREFRFRKSAPHAAPGQGLPDFKNIFAKIF
jgi:hypothetical protein